MRRSDRAVTDLAEIQKAIDHCKVCRLAFQTDDAPYIVPLNFGYSTDPLQLYFHSAPVGRKLDLIQTWKPVGFEMDCDRGLEDGGEIACAYSYYFESIIGTGTISIVTDPEEKLRALQALMTHMTGTSDYTFSPNAVAAVCVFRLDVQTLSCKRRAATT